jgi:glucose-1-phosphate cytidylyltransferase
MLVAFHQAHGKLATVTAVRPPARFGGLVLDKNGAVKKFTEKSQANEGWINGGFLVFNPKVLDMLQGNVASLEVELLEKIAKMGQLAAFCHDGFWQCVDTLRDLKYLESLWNAGNSPWKVW